MRRALQLLAAALFTVCPISIAQTNADIEQGLIPYGAYQHGDVDSVNLANGNVTIHIPLLSYPQRGGKLGLSFSVVANNKGWFVYNSGTNLNWRYPSPNPNSPPGGPNGVTSPVEDHSVSIAAKILKVTDYSGAQWLMHTYAILTADGSSHEIVSTDGEGLLVGTGEAIDASGYRFEKTNNTVVSSDGVRVSTLGNTTTDPNGNQITIGTGGWTDTIGRVIPPMLSTTGSTANCPTGTAVAYLWTVPAFNGATATYKFCYANYNYQTSFGETGVNEFGGTTQLLSAVVLPNLTKWQFTYDSYANVTSVAFPTGGSITYTYGNVTLVANKSRVVTTRKLNANDGTGDHTTNYQWKVSVGGQTYNVVTDPAGNDTLNQPCNGNAYVCVSKYYSGSYSSGSLLKTVTNQYHAETDPYDQYTQSGANANVVLTSTTTAWSGGKTSQTTTNFDPGFTYYIFQTSDDSTSSFNGYYGNPTLQTFSDYGSGAPGSILKQVSTSYKWQTDSNYTTENLLSLVAASKLLDVNGNLCAETDYAYDDTSRLSTPNPAVTMQHVAAPGPKRGNLSSVAQQLTSTPCQSGASWSGITSYVNVYDTGTNYQSIDPLGHTTTYAYSSTFYGAYPTTMTNALSQSITNNFDFNTGLFVSSTDLNSRVTSFTYDNMWRLASATYPDGGSAVITHQETSFPFTATLTKKITSTQNLVKTNVFDGVGRLTQNQVNSASSVIYADTTYDAVGNVHTVSNPHFSASSPTDGTTTYIYDPLHRVCVVAPPDGTVPSGASCPTTQPSDDVFTTYVGNTTTVTDQSGKSRESVADGLGRLMQMFEDPGSSPHLNYETDYTYNPLGDLLTVNQHGGSTNSANWRTRTFTYNSLSQLLTASNPESGTITYTYDNNGNVLTKKDARNITINYLNYDALNRLGAKSFSDGTESLYYYYDVPPGWMSDSTNVVGRLANTSNSSGGSTDGKATAATFSYDAMGRIVREWEQTPSTSPGGGFIYQSYDLAGDLTSSTNAAGVTISYAYDSAARPTTVTSSWNDAQHPATLYAVDPSIGYFPSGAIRKATLPNLLTEITMYNNRLQPCRMEINSTTTASFVQCTDGVLTGNVLDFNYGYNFGSSDNGNVVSWSSVGNQTFTRSYGYDSLNRIWTMSDTAASQACKGLSWTINPWGNRTDQNVTAGTCGTFHAIVGTNNRFGSPYQYDAAGNMTYDGIHSYTYDAENRLTQVDAGATATYIYDPSGNRVRKNSGGSWTEYFYDTAGSVTAEHNSAGWPVEYVYVGGQLVAQYRAGTTYSIFKDHLGSTRLITKLDKTVYDSLDFMPFGEQIAGDTGTTHKFTGKERDSESGLDNFGARYNSSSLGRFMSPDPVTITPERLNDPQQLNAYTYVRNNPLLLVDPTGMILHLFGNTKDDLQDLCSIVGADNCSRISVNDKGIVSFDTQGLDLSKNAGAALINDLVQSQNNYGFSEGPTVQTAGGDIKVSYIQNLDNRPDSRYDYRKQPGKVAKELPPAGVDDIVAINRTPNGTIVSLTNLQVADRWTVIFHELAEAYSKIDGSMQYRDAHNAARQREDALRDQRPYLKEHNPGSGGPAGGPEDSKIIIKQ